MPFPRPERTPPVTTMYLVLLLFAPDIYWAPSLFNSSRTVEICSLRSTAARDQCPTRARTPIPWAKARNGSMRLSSSCGGTGNVVNRDKVLRDPPYTPTWTAHLGQTESVGIER